MSYEDGGVGRKEIEISMVRRERGDARALAENKVRCVKKRETRKKKVTRRPTPWVRVPLARTEEDNSTQQREHKNERERRNVVVVR